MTLSDQSSDPELVRRVRSLRLRTVGCVLAWLAVVFLGAYWLAQQATLREIAEIAVRTEQYRESATRLASQTFIEQGKLATVLSRQQPFENLSSRYSALALQEFAGLPKPKRLRYLQADPMARSISTALATLVVSVRYDLIYILDKNGIVVASSDFDQPVSILGDSFVDRRYFQDAMTKGEGRMFLVQRRTNVPGFFFSAQLGPADKPIGAIVARQSADAEAFVNLLTRSTFEYAILDQHGMVVSSSDKQLVLRHVPILGKPAPYAAELADLYQLTDPRPVAVVRPESPLHENHWKTDDRHVIVSIGPLAETGFQLAIISPLKVALTDRRNFFYAGLAVALLGVAAGLAIFLVLAGHAREDANALKLASINADLERANAEKNRYLGIAAHDLRNPLSSLRGLSQLLLEMEMAPEQKMEFIQTIHRTSDELLGLVNDLLDVSQIEAGKFELRLAPMDLAALVLQRLVHLTPFATRKSIEIDTQAIGSIHVLIDKARFSQVIDNLIGNAIKFSPPGSSVRVSVSATDGKVCFSVDDQGPGISEMDRAKLFKSFQKLSAVPTAGEKSTGLGLAIVKRIIDAHGGEIRVENLDSGGARFSVTLAEYRTEGVVIHD